MSRALNAIEEFVLPQDIARDALLLDEPRVFFQQWEGWEPTGTGGGGAGGGTAVGAGLFDLQGNYLGKLVSVPGIFPKSDLAISNPANKPALQSFRGGTFLIDAGMGKFWHVMVDPQGSVTKSITSTVAAGGAGTAPQWRPGEQQMEQQALQHRIDQDIADLAWAKEEFAKAQAAEDRRAMEYAQLQMRMMEKRLENDKRTLLYGEIGAATRTVFQAQEAERGRQQEMAGEDPFRFTATLRGRGTTGPTPTDIFKQQGAAFANQPLPQFSIEDSIPVLEAGLRGLEKMAITGAPQGLIPGLAEGGIIEGPFGLSPSSLNPPVIEMERGGDGAFSMRPTRRESYLVGDAAGVIPGVTETLTVEKGPFGIKSVEVTPLAGVAQGGLNIPGLDFGGFPDLLESLRRSRGLGGFLAQPGFGGETLSVRDVLLHGQASALGAFQRAPGTLLQAKREGRAHGPVFVVDESGQLRGFTSADVFRRSGFDFGDVQQITAGQLGRFERGENIYGGPFTLPLPNYEGAFGTLGQPLETRRGFLELAAVNPNFSRQDAIDLSNRIGFLPAPHKIARDFPLLDPAEQQGILSLYELAGFPTASFQRIIGAATPRAGAFGGRRIGFVGGRA